MSIHIVEYINARTQRKTCCNAKDNGGNDQGHE